jgi:ribosomal protein S17E
MKISGVNNFHHKEQVKKDRVDAPKKATAEPAATFEKTKQEDIKTTYDKTTIDKLKNESNKSFDTLKKMVEEMLKSQGKALKDLLPGELVKVDGATRAQASQLIADDGPLGIEAMSDKIVDFAKAISGGDKTKLATLKNAIDKGFQEAGRVLGSLPEISMKTYDRIMEKLNIWEKGNEEGVQ